MERKESGPPTLLEALAEVPDHRGRQGRRYPLSAVLTLAVTAMLAGARSLTGITEWGRAHGEYAAAVGLPQGRAPCVSTLHYVFRGLDRPSFEAAVSRWAQSCLGVEEDAIAVDGKTARGSGNESLPGVHLVAAYAHRAGLVLDQEGAGTGEGELTALRTLLERLPLAGRVLTGDAQFLQRDVCERVVEKGGTGSWY